MGGEDARTHACTHARSHARTHACTHARSHAHARTQWLLYVLDHLAPLTATINWHNIPLYPTFVHSMLTELRVRKPTMYPESLLHVTEIALADARLLRCVRA